MKYFFIGLTATGNQTSANAMRILGYRTKHFPRTIKDIDRYEVLTDTPTGMWYRENLLNKNSIFILTTRHNNQNLTEWLCACEKWFTPKSSKKIDNFTREVRYSLFGQLVFEKQLFTDRYWEHIETCERIAQQNDIYLNKWDLVATPTWEFLSHLTKRKSSVPFPFTPKDPIAWGEKILGRS